MQITVIGVGLIGGSFALAVKQRGLAERVVGCDRAQVLERARCLQVIDEAIAEPEIAIKGSDLVLLATPVGAILDLIERVGPLMPAGSLLADVGSTKVEIVARARDVFGSEADGRFVPGHPMAGKEHGGIEHADATLFDGAGWMISPVQPEAAVPQKFLNLVQGLGSHPVMLDAALHDHLCAWISHMPQMVATALAAAVVEEFRDEPELLEIGGRALREMTRLAQSPYSTWRDIALTNTSNIQDALLRVEQRLAHIRENLRTRALEAEFANGQKLRRAATKIED